MENNSSTIEIDVLFLLKKLWAKKFMILFTSLLFATAVLAVSSFVLTPKYTSTTRIYVGNQRGQAEGKITTQDLQVGDYLVKDYKEIITSKDVLLTVIEKEGLNLSKEALMGKLSVSIPTNTRIISISIEDENPSEATRLANAVREVASEKIMDITQVETVKTMEEAEDASAPSSPNLKRNVLLGALAGGFLALVIVMLTEILNDRVRRPEDVEEVLGLTLLGLVPDTAQIK